MFKKIISSLLIIAVITAIVFMAVKSRAWYNNKECKGLSIRLSKNSDTGLIVITDLKKSIEAEMDSLEGIKIYQLDIDKIKHLLKRNEYIESFRTEVSLSGLIEVDIRQRRPVARLLFSPDDHYFLFDDGRVTARRVPYHSRLLVVSGGKKLYQEAIANMQKPMDEGLKPAGEEMGKLTSLLREIKDNAFLNAQIEEVIMKDDNTIEMIPMVGSHIIHFGDTTGMKDKFIKLIAFYSQGIQQSSWDAYRDINLSFSNQIVCIKK